MFIIATVDRDWAIGRKGSLLCRMPIDDANFRSLTAGKTVVYGRKTLDSLRRRELFVGCENVILTHDRQFHYDGATIIHDIADLKQFKSDELFIVGGESIFRQLYKECGFCFLTKIESSLGGDAFFPNLVEEGWKEMSSTPLITYDSKPYRFITYRNPEYESYFS